MASLVTANPAATPSTCAEGYISCAASFGGGCCGASQTCGPSYLTFDGEFKDPSAQSTAVCYNGPQPTHWHVGHQWWNYETPSAFIYNYHAPFPSQRNTPPGGGFPPQVTSSGQGRAFLTYSPGVCPTDYETLYRTYKSDVGVYGALCCRSGWTLVTTPGKIIDGTSTSTDYGPACQAEITNSAGATVLVRLSDSSSAQVTIPGNPTQYWSSKAVKTGTAQAYGIAVFFKPSDISLLDPPPQTPIGTDIPAPSSSVSQAPIDVDTSSSLSPGVIAGIAIGVTVLFLAGAIFGFCCLRRRRRVRDVAPEYHDVVAMAPMRKEIDSNIVPMERPQQPPVEIGSSGPQFYLAELGSSTNVASVEGSRTNMESVQDSRANSLSQMLQKK